MKSLALNKLVGLSRYLVALLFLFSGVAKAVNPFGLSIQFGEYFSAMGIEFLLPLASLFAILLPAFETALGLMLLAGVFRRFTAVVVTLFMSFFTLLTLWIALYNPVSDCGCFGDLLKISNWSTFIKNVIFMVPTLIILKHTPKDRGQFVSLKMIAIVILSLVTPLYSMMNLPPIDATPFKIGVNIPEAMAIPEDAPVAQVETILIYKNLQTQEQQEFLVTDTTWYDSQTWEYVDSRSRVISEGLTPSIPSLPLLDRNGEDQHPVVLSAPEMLLVITNDLQHVEIEKIYELMSQGQRVAIVTSQPLNQLPSEIEAYNSDFTLIRTMIQYPKGGAMLLRGGEIISKWTMDQLLYEL